MRLQRVGAFFVVFGFLLVCCSPIIQGQQPGGSVNLDCEGPLNIPVYPGSTKIGSVICTVENPTTFNEKIEIDVDSGNLSNSAPGSMHVAAGETEEFQINVRAEEGMLAQSLTLIVKATVTEINGAPPPNLAEDEEEEIINILQYGRVSISSENFSYRSSIGDDFSIEFTVRNDGNGDDTLQLSSLGPRDEALESAGYGVVFPSENIRLAPGESETVVVYLKAPNQVSSNALQEGSLLVDVFDMELSVSSEFSCKDESGCFTESLIFIIELEEEVPVSSKTTGDASGGFSSMLGGDGIAEEIGVAAFLVVIVGLLFYASNRNSVEKF